MQEALTTQYWRNQKPERVLHSMFFDKNLFMSLVQAPGSISNAGGAGGRLEQMLRGSSYDIHTFDAAVMLGLLSVLTRKQRMITLKEIRRALRQDGLVVISERKRDPQLEAIYKQEAVISGENGTLPAYSSDGNIEFFVHHFGKTETHTNLQEAGLTPVITTENYFISTHSGNIYQGLQVYAKKI